MSCHVAAERAARPAPLLQLRSRPLRVVLVGNPNVGESVLFGRLTGRYATVSNYPGTTVGVTRGRALLGAEVFDLIDSPGVTALDGALSEDEQVTRRLLANREADLVVQVADARNLRRTLMLTAVTSAYDRSRVRTVMPFGRTSRFASSLTVAPPPGLPTRAGSRSGRRAARRRR